MMTPEDAWLQRLAAEDVTDWRVVSYNYRFERRHDILTGSTRETFVEALLRNRLEYELPGEPSTAYLEYQDTIFRNRGLWTLGRKVSFERPLVMVKHGAIVFREHWSFLSGLPDVPDDSTILSTLGGPSSGRTESPDGRRLRLGAAIRDRLLAPGTWREQINTSFRAGSLGELTADAIYSADSYGRYHDSMVTEGYVPIWWVTSADALAEVFADGTAGPMSRAVKAAVALGLRKTRLGPYYVVQIPPDGLVEHDVYKPTVLSYGCPHNFCAVVTHADPGVTARLGDGEPGLVEAVVVPIDTLRDGIPRPWPRLEYLGPITDKDKVPKVSTARIRERLA